MKISHIRFILALILSYYSQVFSQVTVVSALYTTYNITPNSLMQINVLNSQSNTVGVIIESIVYNANHEPVLTVKTNPIQLVPGVNIISNNSPSFQLVQYAPTKQAEYVRNTKRMPSGIYRFCSTIKTISNSEAIDYYCEDQQSDFSNFLVLTYPMDKDTIEIKNPLLNWNHSEPFDILTSGEYYKLILVELKEGQSAEDGININNPIYMKDFLTTHQVQYPMDAPALKPGGKYAWQVQKVTNNMVTNKTEAWEFIMKKPKIQPEIKYARLSKDLNASFFTVTGSKLFFTFQKEYSDDHLVNCKIIQSNTTEIIPDFESATLVNVDEDTTSPKINELGRYYINLQGLNLSTNAYYFLEVLNRKGEKSYIKFYITSNAW